MNIENNYKSMYCPSCGKKLEIDDRLEYAFCQYCGHKFKIAKDVSEDSKVNEDFDYDGSIDAEFILPKREEESSISKSTAPRQIEETINSMMKNIETMDLEQLEKLRNKLEQMSKNKLLTKSKMLAGLLDASLIIVKEQIKKKELELKLEKDRKAEEERKEKERLAAEKIQKQRERAEKKAIRKEKISEFVKQHENEYVSVDKNKNSLKFSSKGKKGIFATIIAAITIMVAFGMVVNFNINSFKWKDVILNDNLPKPPSIWGDITSNTEDSFLIEINKVDYDEYIDYVDEWKSSGYLNDAIENTDNYTAFNDDGYEVDLAHFSYDEKLVISYYAPIYQDELHLSDNGLYKLLPEPKSNTGKIYEKDSSIELYISNTNKDEVNSYIELCRQSGFDQDIVIEELNFSAKNSNGDKVHIIYERYNIMHITVEEVSFETELDINIILNFLFNKYNVEVLLDGSILSVIEDGGEDSFKLNLTEGEHQLVLREEDDSDVNASVEFLVSKDIEKNKFKYEATRYAEYIEIRAVNDKVQSTPEPSSSITPTATPIPTQNPAEILDETFPREMAKRAVVVAMTNGQATDVFSADGNSYDTTKFHSYSDVDDFFMTVDEIGTWSVVENNVWHVENMVLRIYNYDTYLKVTCKVKNEGDNCIVYNVDKIIAAKKYINSDDPSKVSIEQLEPKDSNPFLTVPNSLIEEDRDDSAAQEIITVVEERQRWIENQFHWWDGRHIKMSELIKDNLNDSSSYKHLDVSYIDVCDDDVAAVVNQTLKDSNFTETVKVGDLFVIQEFSAKNMFNATVKNTGYGIVRGDTDAVILLGIS